MPHSEANNHRIEPIFLGVKELVDKHEWEMAIEKSPKLPMLVRSAIRACLLNEKPPVDAVHTTVARALMNTEFSVKIVGRRLEEFFFQTFGIPRLHSQNREEEPLVPRGRNHEEPSVHEQDEHEGETHHFRYDDDDFDNAFDYDQGELAA